MAVVTEAETNTARKTLEQKWRKTRKRKLDRQKGEEEGEKKTEEGNIFVCQKEETKREGGKKRRGGAERRRKGKAERTERVEDGTGQEGVRRDFEKERERKLLRRESQRELEI